jgi:hypothetical protein
VLKWIWVVERCDSMSAPPKMMRLGFSISYFSVNVTERPYQPGKVG